MGGYLEDSEILDLLEESENKKKWSKEKEIESSYDDREIDHLSVEDLSSSDIFEE